MRNVVEEHLDDAEESKLDVDTARLLYREICSSHDAITDFRAKLLALLPLASGAGVFLLLDGGFESSALGPGGLFGFAVVLGLFVYELRGVQTCEMLRDRAEKLEREELKVPPDQSQYRDRPPAQFFGLVGAGFAGRIIYGAILFAWLYVAGVGFNWWQQLSSLFVVVGYLVVLAVVGGATMKKRARR